MTLTTERPSSAGGGTFMPNTQYLSAKSNGATASGMRASREAVT